MAVRELNPGNTEALLEESVSSRIEEFLLTDYGRVVEVVALSAAAREEAEDAVQVALLRILAQDGQSDLLGLHVTVMACDLISSRRRRAAGILGWMRKGFALHRADPDWTGGALRRAVSQLPRGQRMASLLHYCLGYAIPEISSVLGIPRPIVKARLRRAGSKLKVLLD